MIKMRPAKREDLPALWEMTEAVVAEMEKNGVSIWDEIYPAEIFPGDIEKGQLYLLTDTDGIAAAFALCTENDGAAAVVWPSEQEKSDKKHALYIDRLEVCASRCRQGIGKKALDAALELAREKGADVLRLFVVDINIPALRLYEKSGFVRAQGAYEEKIDETLTLVEYGYEKAVK